MSLQDRVTQIYKDARDDVYRYLLTLGLKPGDAQDLTQDVFLRLFQFLQRGGEIENPRAWAFRVAHNLAVNSRTRQRIMDPVDTHLERITAGGGLSPEHQVLAAEANSRLHEALATLSPQQRQCLHLRAEGLRYREIAETIGIGVSTVSEFLGRAVTRLRKAVHG
jgi:RNA polymerase sigma-70 factor (ECF subfamily)